MYYRGSNFLHTLRAVVSDDSLWREMLLGLNRQFYHQTVGTEALVRYISEVLGLEVAPMVRQYLIDTRLPVLEYGFRDGKLRYRYAQVSVDFTMPIDVKVDILSDEAGKNDVVFELRLKPTTNWQSLDLSEVMDLGMAGLALEVTHDGSYFLEQIQWNLSVAPDFYLGTLEVNPVEKGAD